MREASRRQGSMTRSATWRELQPGLLGQNGRPLKFTPERIQQIRNLLERGKSREEIAEILEVTVNSLAVTCSKLGISLRRVRPNMLAPSTPPTPPTDTATNGNGAKPTNGPRANASLAIVFSYRGQKKVTEIPILAKDLIRFVFMAMAAFSNQSIGDIVADFLRAEIKKR
jgi:Helix-turn-helix domain of resolvase